MNQVTNMKRFTDNRQRWKILLPEPTTNKVMKFLPTTDKRIPPFRPSSLDSKYATYLFISEKKDYFKGTEELSEHLCNSILTTFVCCCCFNFDKFLSLFYSYLLQCFTH